MRISSSRAPVVCASAVEAAVNDAVTIAQKDAKVTAKRGVKRIIDRLLLYLSKPRAGAQRDASLDIAFGNRAAPGDLKGAQFFKTQMDRSVVVSANRGPRAGSRRQDCASRHKRVTRFHSGFPDLFAAILILVR